MSASPENVNIGGAVLDACVLFSGRVTDFLLCLGEQGLFDPVWSDEIHDEWTRNLTASYGWPQGRTDYRRSSMERSFPVANCNPGMANVMAVRALCNRQEELKDAHVVACAIEADAAFIVTYNVDDFQDEVLNRFGLAQLKPDAFCSRLFEKAPFGVAAAAKAHRASLKKSNYDVESYLEFLSTKVMLPSTAQNLTMFAKII